MIPTHHDDGVLELTGFLEFLKQDPKASIEGGNLTQVVGQVLPDVMDIGKEGGHLSLQVIWIDSPKLLARTLGPFAVNVCGTKPVGERLIFLSSAEERFEVPPGFTVKLPLGILYRHPLGNPAGYVLGKTVEFAARFCVSVRSSSDPGVPWIPRGPNLVSVSDMVTRILQQQGPGRDLLVPDRTLKNGSPTRLPKVSTGKDGTPTWRA